MKAPHPSRTQGTRQLVSSNYDIAPQRGPSKPDGPSMGGLPEALHEGFSDWAARGRAWGLLFSLLSEMPLITRIISSAYEIIHYCVSIGFIPSSDKQQEQKTQYK